MSMIPKLANLKMRQKLIFAMLIACLVPLSIVSVVSTNEARSALEKQAFNQLQSLREVKKKQIEGYFEQIKQQVITFSEQDTVVDAMSAFNASYASLPAETGATPQKLAAYRAAVANYYKGPFASKYRAENDTDISTDRLIPTAPASIVAQYLYIANNSNQPGSKDNLQFADDGSSYSQAHAKYHPLFRSFMQRFGFYDLFLIDANSGEVVYSVYKEIDYGGNLLSGPHSDSNLARVFRDARSLGTADGASLVDFEAYLPSMDAAASFMASPIYRDSELTGVLVFQMPAANINAVMQERSGLGETGETYLLGSDLLMRSQSLFVEDNSILETEVDTVTSRAAKNGETGAIITADYRGASVLSSYTPLAIPGLSWTIMAEIDEAEAFAPVAVLIKMALMLVAAGVILTILLAIVVAKKITTPINYSVAIAERIAADDLTGSIEVDSTDETGQLLGSLQTMQRNLRKRVESDRTALEESARLKSALDSVQANVMMADVDNVIIYTNDTVQEMFRNAEADLRTALPNFNANDLVGKNIDIFHKNPAHQRGLLDGLTSKYESNIEVANLHFRVIANPVLGTDGKRLGTVVEWEDRTQEVRAERDVNEIVSKVLSGDLTGRIEMQGKTGFFAVLSEGVNGIIENIAGAMGDFGRSASQVRSGSDEIAKGNANLSQRTEEQAASLEETASSMSEMTSTVKQNAEAAEEANTLTASARDRAEQGGEVVAKAVTAMGEINASSKKISDIIATIDEIAFQTNLLALNASVEAARAGEQGRGFAVVASEVRNLAGRSANAAKEIKDLIEDSVEKVENGTRLVNQSGEALGEIVKGIRQVTSIVGNIATASREQSQGIDEVNLAVTQMDEMTQQNAALVEEIAAASEAMRRQADELGEQVARYAIDEAGTSPQASAGRQVEKRSADRPWSGNGAAAPAGQAPVAAAGGGDNW